MKTKYLKAKADQERSGATTSSNDDGSSSGDGGACGCMIPKILEEKPTEPEEDEEDTVELEPLPLIDCLGPDERQKQRELDIAKRRRESEEEEDEQRQAKHEEYLRLAEACLRMPQPSRAKSDEFGL